MTAPSAHNTQPWRIELVSDVEAQLFFDPNRMLPGTDPPGRQVHIRHGTLIEMTAIAATSLGFRTDIDVLPDGEMSIPEFGTKPTATIWLVTEPGLEVDPLFSRSSNGAAAASPTKAHRSPSKNGHTSSTTQTSPVSRPGGSPKTSGHTCSRLSRVK
ncbi:MAG: hypothetical protein ACRDWI_16500 [Jiangellaceae bacterium]